MFTVYVLMSLKTNKRYIGYTSKTAEQRLREHNAGCNSFTKGYRPFTIVFAEQYATKYEAIRREIFLKSGQGRKFLDDMLR